MDFYSRASREARLKRPSRPIVITNISTHAPLARRDKKLKGKSSYIYDFYSRASREARLGHLSHISSESEISTHAPLARRDVRLLMMAFLVIISTHAPLARRDMVIALLF